MERWEKRRKKREVERMLKLIEEEKGEEMEL